MLARVAALLLLLALQLLLLGEVRAEGDLLLLPLHAAPLLGTMSLAQRWVPGPAARQLRAVSNASDPHFTGGAGQCIDQAAGDFAAGRVTGLYGCDACGGHLPEHGSCQWQLQPNGDVAAPIEPGFCLVAVPKAVCRVVGKCVGIGGCATAGERGPWIREGETLRHTPTGLYLSAPGGLRTVSLPRVNIDPARITTEGGSSGGDFAIQMAVAHSATISGVCGNSAQPYHCANTRFPKIPGETNSGDSLMPQSSESSVPYCRGCPRGKTLVYDHCKNHGEWVQVPYLVKLAREDHGIDLLSNLNRTRVLVTRGECRTYTGNAVENTLAFFVQAGGGPDSARLIYVDNCHANSSADGCPREHVPSCDDGVVCRGHVWNAAGSAPLKPSVDADPASLMQFDQTEFLDGDYDTGFDRTSFVYIPAACRKNTSSSTTLTLPTNGCGLHVVFHGCGGCGGIGLDDANVRAAEANDVVLLIPRITAGNNASSPGSRHSNCEEIARGCWDGYGQLGLDYASRSGLHVAAVWRMMQRLAGGFLQ